jgi:hypothetical protein
MSSHPLQHVASECLGVDPNISGTMTSFRDINEAAPATPPWTIVCLVLGDSEVFSIKAEADAMVHEMKKTIKSENTQHFNSFDAKDLTLHKVKISTLGNFEQEIQALDLASRKMSGGLSLRYYYPTPPEKEFIHILIQPPPPGEFLCIGRMTRLTNHFNILSDLPIVARGTKRKSDEEAEESPAKKAKHHEGKASFNL